MVFWSSHCAGKGVITVDKPEFVNKVNKLIDIYSKFEKDYDELDSILKFREIPQIFETFYLLVNIYIDSVFKEDGEWVMWYIIENECGKGDLKAKAKPWKKFKKIDTVDMLYKVISEE